MPAGIAVCLPAGTNFTSGHADLRFADPF